MEWRDRGIVLTARPFGESGMVVHLLTEENGRYAGLFRGGHRAKAELTPGVLVDAQWYSRLDENLGNYRLEVMRNIPAFVIDDPERLKAVRAALAVTEMVVQEREPASGVFGALSAWLELLEGEYWGEALVRYELGLLMYAGAGLDLSSCAATGTTENLVYVSPKSGRAVSQEAGALYKDRMLTLPGFLMGESGGTVEEGLKLTGYFLETRVAHAANRPLPDARMALHA